MNIALITLAAVTAVSLLRDPIVGSDPGLTFSRDLMWSSRSSAFQHIERSAFIVDHGEGVADCALWPDKQ